MIAQLQTRDGSFLCGGSVMVSLCIYHIIIVITCTHIDSIKRVCSEPPCCPGEFSDLSSVHDNSQLS